MEIRKFEISYRDSLNLDSMCKHLLQGSIGFPKTTLLRGITFAPIRGQAVLTPGPRGTGESTLLRALAGIWPCGRGDDWQRPIMARKLTTRMRKHGRSAIISGTLRGHRHQGEWMLRRDKDWVALRARARV